MRFFSIIFIISALFLHCSNDRNYNKISVLYSKHNSYYDKELKNSIQEWKFDNNYSLTIDELNYDSLSDIKEKIINNKSGIIIAETDNSELTKKLYSFSRHHHIILNLIANSTNHKYNNLFITDYKELGNKIAFNLYDLSRSRRNIFILYLNNNYIESYYKKELIKGFIEFCHSKQISIITNTYTKDINKDKIKIELRKWITIYNNNIRGIFTENESIAIMLMELIRRAGKDGEIKIASFGATIDGINSMLKIGLAVTGDIYRLKLFRNALEYSKTNKLYIKRQRKIFFIKGIIYNQTILLDRLSKSKKYSIQQLIAGDK